MEWLKKIVLISFLPLPICLVLGIVISGSVGIVWLVTLLYVVLAIDGVVFFISAFVMGLILVLRPASSDIGQSQSQDRTNAIIAEQRQNFGQVASYLYPIILFFVAVALLMFFFNGNNGNLTPLIGISIFLAPLVMAILIARKLRMKVLWAEKGVVVHSNVNLSLKDVVLGELKSEDIQSVKFTHHISVQPIARGGFAIPIFFMTVDYFSTSIRDMNNKEVGINEMSTRLGSFFGLIKRKPTYLAEFANNDINKMPMTSIGELLRRWGIKNVSATSDVLSGDSIEFKR